jgi:hypothetical protein
MGRFEEFEEKEREAHSRRVRAAVKRPEGNLDGPLAVEKVVGVEGLELEKRRRPEAEPVPRPEEEVRQAQAGGRRQARVRAGGSRVWKRPAFGSRRFC